MNIENSLSLSPTVNNASRKEIYLSYINITKEYYQPALEKINDVLKKIQNELTKSDIIINPIDFIETRIKNFDKLWEKFIIKFGKEPDSIQEITSNLYDIAGMRIICAYKDDIYVIREILRTHHDGIEVLDEERDKSRDYVKKPKENGYSSLHLRVRVMINDRPIIVEVQIRSMLMHLWAKIEHNLRYKSVNSNPALKAIFSLLAKTFRGVDEILTILRDQGNVLTEEEFKNLLKNFN